jgi:alpha-1,2-mannosyltransferase
LAAGSGVVGRTFGAPARIRGRRLAILALVSSVLVRLVWMLMLPNGMNLVDLRVYIAGSAALGSGHLYDFTYADKTPDFPLPFTYPPFAAMVFYPLHYLPFTLVAVGWLLAIAGALYAVVRISFALMLGPAAREPSLRTTAIAWTAVGLWLEPTRTSIDYGQVDVFLVLAGMLAAYTTVWWLSGLLVGVAAGVKLTPAFGGLYFLTRRRWGSAIWSAAVFAATVAVSLMISPGETRTYFGPLLGDANRIGPVGSVWNQSLRGALTRILGHDAGAPWYLGGHRIPAGPWWLGGIVVMAVLAVFAWRALYPGDRLGALLVVQLFGLITSPISWSHHWVWLLPVILWLVYGPLRTAAGARIMAGYWLVTTLVGAPWVLSFFQPSIWTISRPGVLAWLGAVDVVGVLLFYGWVIRVGARSAGGDASSAGPADRSAAPAPHPAG